MYGKDFAYASTRITNTIVRVLATNEPVLVLAVNRHSGACTLEYLVTPDGQDKRFILHMDELNVQPVRLGYVNLSGQAFYLERSPIRHGPNNQGLNRENCNSSRYRIFDFPVEALRYCIMGIYPSYKKAVAGTAKPKRNGDPKTIAFNRHWAVRGGKTLLYRWDREVGSINKDGLPELSPSFSYLNECLAELL